MTECRQEPGVAMAAATVRGDQIDAGGLGLADARHLWGEWGVQGDVRTGRVLSGRVLNRPPDRPPAAAGGRSAADPYLVFISQSGWLRLEQNGLCIRVAPGQAGLATAAQPFSIDQPASSRSLVLSLPREQVAARIGAQARMPSPLDLSSGLGAVIAAMASAVLDRYWEVTEGEFDAVVQRIAEITCLSLGGGPGSRFRGRLAGIEEAARQHVRVHAGDPDLRGETIAADLGWSLRQVQLALQAAGTTPRRLIKETRLQLARELLGDPAHRALPVAEVARRTGFTSPSAFSVAFRERFGLAPRDVRRR
ncbi:AraC family transcriptional regulator [Nocardiopsis coralliicola]